jgi:hypothetical protein
MPSFRDSVITQPAFVSSADQLHSLGQRAESADGRKFRYVKAGASALVVGNMIQAPAELTNHDQLTPSAASIGATEISVTLGATAVTANQYADGWICIDTTPALGYFLKIKSHPAAALSAAVVLTLRPEDALPVAITTSTRITLVPNPYKAVIQTPVSTLTGATVGAAIYPITAAEFGWIQTGGPAAVLIAGTPGVGLAVVVPGTAAGCVVVDGAAAATQVVGSMMVTGVDGKVLPVYLTLD